MKSRQSQSMMQLPVCGMHKVLDEAALSETLEVDPSISAESAGTPATTDASFASKTQIMKKKLLFKNNSFYPRLKKLQQREASQKLGFVFVESSSRSELLFKRNLPYKNDTLNQEVNVKRHQNIMKKIGAVHVDKQRNVSRY